MPNQTFRSWFIVIVAITIFLFLIGFKTASKKVAQQQHKNKRQHNASLCFFTPTASLKQALAPKIRACINPIFRLKMPEKHPY